MTGQRSVGKRMVDIHEGVVDIAIEFGKILYLIKFCDKTKSGKMPKRKQNGF